MSVPTATPVYTVAGAYGSWQGNVLDDWGVDWIVESEEGWSSSPPAKPVNEERTAGDGSWSGPGFFGPRVVVLKGRAIAPDRTGMLRAKERIRAAVSPRDRSALVVEEEHRARTAQVRLSDQLDIADEGPMVFGWTLQLVAADPRRYSTSIVTTSTTLPPAVTTGRTYSRTYDRSYGALPAGGSGRLEVIQDGDYDQTPAVIVFAGPVAAPGVEHLQTGRTLVFDLTLTGEDRLVVDLAAQTALLNGTASRANTITNVSSWFLLVPGVNELKFRGTAGTPPPTPTMTVTAASAWT